MAQAAQIRSSSTSHGLSGLNLLHRLEVQIKKDPYGMLRHGFVLGAGLATLNRRRLKSGALLLVKSAMSQILDSNDEIK